jgi:hypothetical protein
MDNITEKFKKMDITGKFGYLTGEVALPYTTSEEREIFRKTKVEEISFRCMSEHANEYWDDEDSHDDEMFKAYQFYMDLLTDHMMEIDECIRRLGL